MPLALASRAQHHCTKQHASILGERQGNRQVRLTVIARV
jgi:hypothetical protein